LLDGTRFEIVVIGGGINGVAIARECARLGRRTLLLERHDFGSGTTSRSTRIIHGGLRYIENGQFDLVRESLRERERLLRRYPQLVRPLQFLLTLGPYSERTALEIRVGLALYRALDRGKNRNKPAQSREPQVEQFERMLDAGRRWSVFSFQDAQCEFPERIVAEWLQEGLLAGLVARNHAEVIGIETRKGRVQSVTFRDEILGKDQRVAAQSVINASGPWADQVCAAADIEPQRPLIGGVRGSHLVMERFPGAPECAVYSEALDGRPMFIVPWNGALLVGTTEVIDRSNPSFVAPARGEIDYLFRSLRRLLPRADIQWSQIHHAFAGVRPLPYSPPRPSSAIPRRHILHDHKDEGAAGMISVVGGKLTTAAAVARDVAQKLRIGSTEAEPQLLSIAPDSANGEFDLYVRKLAHIGQFSEESARGIAEWHCGDAVAIAIMASRQQQFRETIGEGTPHIVAEAVHAVRSEMAMTLADILLRRVPVALAPWWSEYHSRVAAQRIGTALGWPEARIASELEKFKEERAMFLRRPEPERSSAFSPVERAA
jgi:glycerol-3-phosphate dehydrogenase